MIRYKQLLTSKLISRSNKEPIGKILDVIYSDDYRRITHLVVKNDNLIKNKASIPFEDVVFLEDNQILYLKDERDLDKDLEDILIEDFKYIEKEIKTEDGECIGYVKDIVIDKLKGSIEGFIITEGVFEDILKGRNYMPLFENTKITEDSICIFKSMLNSIDKNNN